MISGLNLRAVLSHSFTGKDANADGAVSFEEFMTPVSGTACVPAFPDEAPSMEELFAAYDKSKDGLVSLFEMTGTLEVKKGEV
ncbi:hypothetical protein GCM10007301_33760 [Azorhizobium oxalatiphilum]|uniref:EF-hand domain-containing protein n=1 Tax=Azorhizobium oxalatiphilum TaxID=980631 RepID=A0A917FFN6_9HYPH|nr:hypothetical protein [Azorhizobium oxalatiphilum]GGF71268.1 hypothetical protein GCM10007301_33760 [Azorhizobium oxalatiphilum]